MNPDVLRRRLQNLESARGSHNAVLFFPNGSQRTIKMRDVLGLVNAASDRASAVANGGPKPQSAFDGQLDLLARCSEVQSDQPMVSIAKSSLDWAANLKGPVDWR